MKSFHELQGFIMYYTQINPTRFYEIFHIFSSLLKYNTHYITPSQVWVTWNEESVTILRIIIAQLTILKICNSFPFLHTELWLQKVDKTMLRGLSSNCHRPEKRNWFSNYHLWLYCAIHFYRKNSKWRHNFLISIEW